MTLAKTLFGDEWEMEEPPVSEADLLNDDDGDEPDVWHGDLGSWLPAMLAPKDRPIDLFVDVFELNGEVVKGCWWDEQAAIPDWYTYAEGGEAVLAAKPWQWVSYWKPRDKPEGPLEDGGPGLGARLALPEDPMYLGGVQKERYDRYTAMKEAA